jgi:hydroxypyruvate isomerase
MERREFLRAGVAALAGACWSGQLTAEGSRRPAADGRFQLKYAPHFGMFKQSAGDDLIDQLKFAAEQGFTAWEDDGLQARPVAVQEKIARIICSLGMEMGAFRGMPAFPEVSFVRKDELAWECVLQELRGSVEVARRANAKWMTAALGCTEVGLPPGRQAADCIELLKRCSAILEPHGLVLVLEPPKGSAAHAGALLPKLPPAHLICRAVGSPSCKTLFDVYHEQVTAGHLIPSMEAAWGEIAYVRCGDNPGRKEPGTGRIDYRQVFAHLRANGYTGIVGMTHGNSKPGSEGERAVIDAYVAADP